MYRSAGKKADGTPFVMLGLDEENIRRLQDDSPIVVNLRHLDPDGPPVIQLPDLEVTIYFANEVTLALVERMGKDADGSAAGPRREKKRR